jgi:hypothetical protein
MRQGILGFVLLKPVMLYKSPDICCQRLITHGMP